MRYVIIKIPVSCKLSFSCIPEVFGVVSFFFPQMAQFTSFASLKEQREANKQKFCNVSNNKSSKTVYLYKQALKTSLHHIIWFFSQKNISSHKPEQNSDKGNKVKFLAVPGFVF